MLLFSQIGQYALRTMTTLALEAEGSALRASDIAERAQIPAAYVSKVLRRLTEAGLLVSQKGHHGGFRLAKSPACTRFEEILAAVDSLPARDVCVFGWGACQASAPCPLHHSWTELSTGVATWAHATCLADLQPARADAAASGRLGDEHARGEIPLFGSPPSAR